ncbi:hypothetical protein K2173_010919 [Erythroxylum novogranatense]|uniref:Pentatricopeptide repeat-containing protein n=1 Tax=Erythroxylum novogranatense TaxID=1862640 RepID=A0AAV8T0J2_9ROSI|nr:hypothetical protein K2173_010919 [Erythroxylum novogranatense]
MWAVRRASNYLKLQRLKVENSYLRGAKSQVTSYFGSKLTISTESARCLSCSPTNVCSKLSVGTRSLSSHAGAKSSKSDDDLEDGFSELETAVSTHSSKNSSTTDDSDDELLSEPDVLDDDHEEEEDIGETSQTTVELSDTEADPSQKQARTKRASELFKAIITSPNSVDDVLAKWVEDGRDLSRTEIIAAMLNLRKRLMYLKALQLSEWLETNKQLDFIEKDYAARLDLIAKLRGLERAEAYIKKIPESFRGEIIYRTFLANCVVANDITKAQEIFNKMRNLQFPVTLFSCNQLLLLYKRHDKKKIADVLLLMEKENVKPSLFTYNLLIDTKGQCNDMTGMDQVVETMKSEGIQPDISTQAILAKHYLSGGLKEKAEGILKEIEGDNLKEHRWVCKVLLPLYASLGKADEVRRVWKVCESKPWLDECLAAIEAWGRLKKIDEAEAVFEMMSNRWNKLSSRHYSVMLKAYANHKEVDKGKDLVKRMADSGCRIGPLTWDALVKLYVEAGEVEKADSMLQKAAEKSAVKPMFTSFMTIMEQYAKKGDVHNTEKMFHRMKQANYESRIRQYQSLVQAYINAKTPAYGIKERMKAENVFPSKTLAAQLAQVDPFRKTAASDLLD